MQHNHEQHHRPDPGQKVSWWKTPFGMVAICFFIIAGYFLIREHSAHIGNNWIWLILPLCPLMHVFMHGGHGGHGGHQHGGDNNKNKEE